MFVCLFNSAVKPNVVFLQTAYTETLPLPSILTGNY